MCYDLQLGWRQRSLGKVLNFYKALFVAPRTDRICNYAARAIYVPAQRDGARADALDRPACLRSVSLSLPLRGPCSFLLFLFPGTHVMSFTALNANWLVNNILLRDKVEIIASHLRRLSACRPRKENLPVICFRGFEFLFPANESDAIANLKSVQRKRNL